MAGLGSSLEPLDRLVLQNGIKPPIEREVPLDIDAVREAVAHVRSPSQPAGKVVISIARSALFPPIALLFPRLIHV